MELCIQNEESWFRWTHDDAVAAYAEREILFKDGVLASDRRLPRS